MGYYDEETQVKFSIFSNFLCGRAHFAPRFARLLSSMAFTYDEVCDFSIAPRFFDAGSDLYSIVILVGFMYTDLQVVNAATNETIEVFIRTDLGPLSTSVRIHKKYLRPGNVLYFMTPERVMPEIFTGPTTKYLPQWVGTEVHGHTGPHREPVIGAWPGGYQAWKWVVPRV